MRTGQWGAEWTSQLLPGAVGEGAEKSNPWATHWDFCAFRKSQTWTFKLMIKVIENRSWAIFLSDSIVSQGELHGFSSQWMRAQMLCWVSGGNSCSPQFVYPPHPSAEHPTLSCPGCIYCWQECCMALLPDVAGFLLTFYGPFLLSPVGRWKRCWA